MTELMATPMQISGSPDLVWGAKNAPVESFAIHLRNLITFFYPRKKDKNAVTAADFFVRPEDWKPPSETDLLKLGCKKANQQAAHLTWDRAKYVGERKAWEKHREMTADIERVWRTFLATVPCENLATERYAAHFEALAAAQGAG